MKRPVVFIALLLFGCADLPQHQPRYTLSQAHLDCVHAAVPFDFYSGCIQSKMQNYAPEWPLDPDADLIRFYFNWTADAGRLVTNDEQARTGAEQASVLLQRLVELSRQRKNAPRPIDWNAALAGFALMQSANQPPPPPAPNAPVTCTTYPTNRVTGQTSTVCH